MRLLMDLIFVLLGAALGVTLMLGKRPKRRESFEEWRTVWFSLEDLK